MNQNQFNAFNDKTEIGIVGAVGVVESCLIIPSKIGETASESDGFYYAIAKSKHFADNSKFRCKSVAWPFGSAQGPVGSAQGPGGPVILTEEKDLIIKPL